MSIVLENVSISFEPSNPSRPAVSIAVAISSNEAGISLDISWIVCSKALYSCSVIFVTLRIPTIDSSTSPDALTNEYIAPVSAVVIIPADIDKLRPAISIARPLRSHCSVLRPKNVDCFCIGLLILSIDLLTLFATLLATLDNLSIPTNLTIFSLTLLIYCLLSRCE